MEKEKILEIRNLDITFKTTAGPVHAIRGVDIDLHKGETVAIVGESGSGKSVTMKAAMGILAKNAIVNSGSISFSYTHADGQKDTVEILEKDKKWIRKHINGKRIAMVFQDPMTSLDPTMSIGKQIMEGMLWHFKMKKEEAWKKSCELLQEVGIEDAEKRMRQYPHQLSGGMRQRVVIAIALACNPDLLICDEPTTALDVTIQAKILELIMKIQRERHQRHLHYPRPRCGGEGSGLCECYVRRKDRGEGYHQRDLLRSEASLYLGSAVRNAGPGDRRRASLCDPRLTAQPAA